MKLKIQEKLVFQTCFLMANRLKFLEILSPQHLLFSLRALFYASPASARSNNSSGNWSDQFLKERAAIVRVYCLFDHETKAIKSFQLKLHNRNI